MGTTPIVIEEWAEERAAVELTAGLRFSVNIKNTRAAMVEAVKNARQIPLVDQECILARIAAIDPKHELLQLTAVCHPHKAGSNLTFTVCEI